MRNYPYFALLVASLSIAAAPVQAEQVDRSGKKQHGKASYYSHRFTHKKTASGLPLDPNKKTAASKTLPLGTKAEVTNVENGKKTEVIVNDRGPYVEDRVIDVTPKAAEELGIKEKGVAKVEVKPVEIPPPSADPKEEVLRAEKKADPTNGSNGPASPAGKPQ
jgi:rare lipoprotein A